MSTPSTRRTFPSVNRIAMLVCVMVLSVAITGKIQAVRAASQGPDRGSGERLWSGVFTTEQAERGKVTTTRVCVFCHNFDLTGLRGPALKGDVFMQNWRDETVYRLFAKIRDTMPPSGTVETLSDEAKLEIVAYLLQINGFPSGNARLTSAAADLEAMVIAPRGAGGPTSLANFSIVRVSGCLVPGAEGSWLLVNASEPVADRGTSAPVSSPPPTSGTETFQLHSLRPFDPASRVRQRADVTGLLYRAPGDNSLTVTALQTLGPCS